MISASEPGRGRRGLGAAGARPALGSVVVHVAAIALAWSSATVRPEMPEFVSYQIDLVSAPAAEDPGMPVVEAIPAPEPPAAADLPPPPVPEKETKPEPAAEPEKAPTPAPARTDPRPTAPRPSASANTPATGTGTESAESIDIRIAGLRRDYPAYYDNIILQIKRCFRWAGAGTPETEVYFVINEDGGVSDARFVRRSGNPSFDYDALGAVECAGQPGRFGPLPDDLPFERLPIRFTFRPGNVTGTLR